MVFMNCDSGSYCLISCVGRGDLVFSGCGIIGG